MEIATDFAPFQEQVTAALLKAIRTTAQISSEDLSFQRSFDSNISESLDLQSSRLLVLINSILKVATSGSDLKPPDLQNEDDLEEKWRAVVDVIDELLEKADACLDEFTGVIKRLSPSQEERGLALSNKRTATRFPSVYDFGPSKIPKPQLSFERPPDNNDISPFKPLLRSKPHAIVPLHESLRIISTGDIIQGYVNGFLSWITGAGEN
jgi:exosome complex exonuclease RRP6